MDLLWFVLSCCDGRDFTMFDYSVHESLRDFFFFFLVLLGIVDLSNLLV